jgi:hypothetical protein
MAGFDCALAWNEKENAAIIAARDKRLICMAAPGRDRSLAL